jgi:FMN-dependent NADH-azoreductase
MNEATLLEVQSSVRQHDSISRQLSDIFIEAWRKHHSLIQHLVRDVGMNPPDHITEFWVKANYTSPVGLCRKYFLATNEVSRSYSVKHSFRRVLR